MAFLFLSEMFSRLSSNHALQRTARKLCALRFDFIRLFPFRSTRPVGLSLSLGR
jgi:hypothetical protein